MIKLKVLLLLHLHLTIPYLYAPMKFNQLQVAEVIKETKDCVSIAFSVPKDKKADYSYTSGQYLTLEKEIDGVKVRRSYSICSHPTEMLRVAVKRVPGGLFSTWANESLAAGMNCQVALPEGGFTHRTNALNENQYVAFVAGSGITPVLSIIKSVLLEEPLSSFVLFYGNKRTQDIIFKEELEGLKNRFMERFQIYHILSRQKTNASILTGRIDPLNCSKYFKYFVSNDNVDKVFLCGPYEMIINMKSALLDMGLNEQIIKFELFYNPEADANTPVERAVVMDTERKIKITLDGVTSVLSSNYDIPILDIASDAGLDLPFSCKGGVCATCKAKVLDGRAEMTTNFALEKEEVANGYILTCQAHVKSESIHVNFDV